MMNNALPSPECLLLSAFAHGCAGEFMAILRNGIVLWTGSLMIGAGPAPIVTINARHAAGASLLITECNEHATIMSYL